ncbi:PREDICTED: peptidyl-prolyl cis-trans isomerase-like 2-like [Elephantulus edwardii]|uniref:peptidyl-prolyl cis-trans isomerase-like 2-like n=1 Tax=Elephantulus edwardii TaxID=28737 RepID=UPI0003F0E8BF|nr:PREDICTED: peptidyl-prolyl cis-trans isomerase-like 2-like [Elephantulus edwardii]
MEALDEFDREVPLTMTFCRRISGEDFEKQASMCTECALRHLFRSIDRNPAIAERAVGKGKQDECEQRGLLSFLWVRGRPWDPGIPRSAQAKFFHAVQGDRNYCNSMDTLEMHQRLEQLKRRIHRVHLYAQAGTNTSTTKETPSSLVKTSIFAPPVFVKFQPVPRPEGDPKNDPGISDLSLQPFIYPVCTPEGVVFDLLSILPWLKKYGTNPSNGEKLDRKSLIELKFAKNNEGEYHCPVLFTVFTNNSHIVAIRTTGNVYAFEAVEQLNIKAKNFRDLLTDEPFSRQDIITLQDPTNLDKFNVSNFYHVKNNMKVTDPDEEKAKQDPSYYLKNTNTETRETLHELYKEFKGDEVLAATMKAPEKKKVDKLNAAHYSTGKVSASFTSTAMVPETTHEAAAIDEDVLRYQFVKKKGYVRLHTNKGCLNLELHCDLTPKTCENFIRLCKTNYYDGTIFHRSIRNFVIQGGDPTGTGTGGVSCWGKPFRDEFRSNLSHSGRGILSMANSGPNSNKSQFFITFRSCAYLDKKHTIFGRVVGGFDTLTAMENVESDPKTDRPKEEICIQSTVVFVDPYEEADAQIAEERKKTQQKEAALETNGKMSQPQQRSPGPQAYRQGVGKYISRAVTKRASEDEPSTSTATSSTKKRPSWGFGDFSSW